VKRAEGFQCFENHEGQSALPDIIFGRWHNLRVLLWEYNSYDAREHMGKQ
jgi:hypothetical protein